MRISMALTFFILLLIGLAADARASSGDPGEVRDAIEQFDALKHHGEALGFVLPDGAPDAGISDHYQGVARYPGPGVPVVYVTQKDTDDPVAGGGAPPGTHPGGYLHVASMGSRPTSGERMRSNLQSRDGNTDEVDPEPADTWVRSIRFDGSLNIKGQTLPAYVHPGGMAVVDDVLLMALDSPTAGGAKGQLVLFDLKPDPTSPRPIRALPLTHDIDNLAAVRRADDTVLIWINGGGGDVTRFYETTTDLRDDNLQLNLVQEWNPGSADDLGPEETVPACGDPGWPSFTAYQGSAFLRQTDGRLFMVMARNMSAVPTPQYCDVADLYRVEPKATGGFRLVRVASKHMWCSFTGVGTMCNFIAAANAYVSPSGELLLYSVPHADKGDYVRFAEFRHRDVSTEDSPLRRPSADAGGPYEVNEGDSVQLSGSGGPAADRPWVELYQHDHWTGRSIVADFDDSGRLELEDFTKLDGFGDETSSLRWRSPPGLDIELYENHGFDGEKRVLKGTGQTETIGDLEDDGFGDTISSMRWVPAGPPPSSLSLAWDLDDDGEFDDSTSATPTFGPKTQDGVYTVRLRVTDASGNSNVDSATVSVHNAPPDCSTVAPSPSTLWAADHQFRLITLSGATDPGDDPLTLTVTGVTQDEAVDGVADGHTAPDAALVPGHSDQVNLRAERSSTGDGRVYHVAFSVADGQGATCSGSADVSVVKGVGAGPAIDSGLTFDSFTDS